MPREQSLAHTRINPRAVRKRPVPCLGCHLPLQASSSVSDSVCVARTPHMGTRAHAVCGVRVSAHTGTPTGSTACRDPLTDVRRSCHHRHHRQPPIPPSPPTPRERGSDDAARARLPACMHACFPRDDIDLSLYSSCCHPAAHTSCVQRLKREPALFRKGQLTGPPAAASSAPEAGGLTHEQRRYRRRQPSGKVVTLVGLECLYGLHAQLAEDHSHQLVG